MSAGIREIEKRIEVCTADIFLQDAFNKGGL